MDRQRASDNIKAGLWRAGLALFVFGFAFYVTILYIA